MIDSVKITDYASPNLTAKLEVNIEESGKGKNYLQYICYLLPQ